MSGCCGKSKQSVQCSTDDEFQSYVRIILSLITTLRRTEDKEAAHNILMHCTKLHNSCKPNVRYYTNAFLTYFIKVLHTNASTQPLEIYDQWYKIGSQRTTQDNTSVWLEKDRSYFAMEKTPDGSILFYSAVATDPNAGWDKGGIKKSLDQVTDY